MRNRSEQLVTSAFIDTDEESDDGSESEDDWKPSNSNKRTTLKSKSRVPKRKSSAKKRKYSESDDEESNDDDDYSDDDDDYFQTPSPSVSVPKKKPEETNFKLLLYVNDLDQNYKNNVHLCLWRRDKNSLLQKYIRVKTDNNEDFIFTSSSVYSSWDEKCASDFSEILVKQEENKRRVQIVDMTKLNALVYKQISVYKNNDNYSDEEND